MTIRSTFWPVVCHTYVQMPRDPWTSGDRLLPKVYTHGPISRINRQKLLSTLFPYLCSSYILDYSRHYFFSRQVETASNLFSPIFPAVTTKFRLIYHSIRC